MERRDQLVGARAVGPAGQAWGRPPSSGAARSWSRHSTSRQADIRLGLIAPRAAFALAALPRGNQVVASAVVIRRALTLAQTDRPSDWSPS
jgi:hypothetical protein